MVELGARCAMPPEGAGSGGAGLPETDESCAEGQACEREGGGSASGITTTTNSMPKMVNRGVRVYRNDGFSKGRQGWFSVFQASTG